MLFKDIPGQESVKNYFRKVVSDDRMPHALMLFGREGHGKLALARSLATYVQCSNRTNTDACGQCPSCIKSTKNIHPDIHYAFPVVKLDKVKREDTISQHFMNEWRSFMESQPYGHINDWLDHISATDKRANINVAECNDIIKNLGLKTYEGAYKIQIIWQANFLQKEANRLLKLIEEPSEKTLIILILENRNSILNTVRSRCQTLMIPPFADETILEFIENNSNLSENDKKELTHLSNGSLRSAIQYIDQTEINYSEELISWLRAAFKMDPEEVNAFIDRIMGSGKQNLIDFFRYGLHFFREFLIYNASEDEKSLRLTESERIVAEKLGKLLDINKISALQSLLSQSITHINRNLSVKILLMSMTFEINAILKSEVNKFVVS